MFVLNTSRPLFRNNPKLRQAVNLAVDRKALTRELGPSRARATDQYLAPSQPGYRDERIYPLKGTRPAPGARARRGSHARWQGGALHENHPVELAQARCSSRT